MAGLDPDGDDPNAALVFRFFDTHNGTHLFTTSRSEVATITSTRPDLVAEQTTFSEHLTARPGDTPVFCFFEKADGTHFYTASNDERESRRDAARHGLRGRAFYSPPAS